MAVPTIYLNGERFGQGRMEIEELLAKVDNGAARAAGRPAEPEEPVRHADRRRRASRARRRRSTRPARALRTGVVAERFGGQVLDTLAIENFISVAETEGPKLAAALEAHVRSYPVDVIKHERVKRRCPGPLADGRARERCHPVGAQRDRGDGRALARHERARRGRVPHPRRDLLPALRRPLVQGQARRGHRRRQLRRRGRDRPRRRGRPRDPAGVRRPAEGRRHLAAQAAQPAQRRGHHQRPHHRGARRRRQVVGLDLRGSHRRGALKSLDVDGVFVQIGLLPNTDFLKGTVELSQFRRDRGRPPGADHRPRRLRRWRRHHGALQANHHRHRRRRQGGPGCVRTPHAQRSGCGRVGPTRGKDGRSADGPPVALAVPSGRRHTHPAAAGTAVRCNADGGRLVTRARRACLIAIAAGTGALVLPATGAGVAQMSGAPAVPKIGTSPIWPTKPPPPPGSTATPT